MAKHMKWIVNGRRRLGKSRGHPLGYWGKKQVQRVTRHAQRGTLAIEDEEPSSSSGLQRRKE